MSLALPVTTQNRKTDNPVPLPPPTRGYVQSYTGKRAGYYEPQLKGLQLSAGVRGQGAGSCAHGRHIRSVGVSKTKMHERTFAGRVETIRTNLDAHKIQQKKIYVTLALNMTDKE